MNYILYRITNKVNGKIYVGVHKTRNLDDGYMGSGKIIRSAIRKHGIENFQKEILETFETAAEMYEREKQIVNEEFLAREDVYNLRCGGYGGFEYINLKNLNITLDIQESNNPGMRKRAGEKGQAKLREMLVDSKFKESYCEKLSSAAKRRMKDFPKLKFKNGYLPFEEKKIAGIKRSAELGKYKGSIGQIWITNGFESLRIKHDKEIPKGWKRGRQIRVKPSG